MIRWKQAVDDFPDYGLTFGNPDFVKYAEAYGATGWRVESTEGLASTLRCGVRGRRGASGHGADRLFGECAGAGR